MAGLAQHMTISLKNTFFEVVDEQEDMAHPRGSRRRTSSTPPAICQGNDQKLVFGPTAEQVRLLDAVMRGAAKPQRLDEKSPAAYSDTSTAPSPPAAVAARWSSIDSETSDFEGLTPVAAGGGAARPGGVAAPVGIPSYPSLGSAGHAAGTCRPCAFARSPAGCKFGADCSFCHLVAEHPESVRMRPCKGKRERFKRAMAAIEAKVAQNPAILSDGSLNLPAFVDRNPQARARIMGQLAQVAADAYRGMALRE